MSLSASAALRNTRSRLPGAKRVEGSNRRDSVMPAIGSRPLGQERPRTELLLDRCAALVARALSLFALGVFAGVFADPRSSWFVISENPITAAIRAMTVAMHVTAESSNSSSEAAAAATAAKNDLNDVVLQASLADAALTAAMALPLIVLVLFLSLPAKVPAELRTR